MPKETNFSKLPKNRNPYKSSPLEQRLVRLFKMVAMLDSRGLSPKYCAQDFGVSLRTVQRDLEVLRAVGLGIRQTHSNSPWYHLEEGFSLHNFNFTEENSEFLRKAQTLIETMDAYNPAIGLLPIQKEILAIMDGQTIKSTGKALSNSEFVSTLLEADCSQAAMQESVLIALGQALRARKEYKKALAVYQKLLKISSKSDYFVGLAHCYRMLKNYPKALRAAQQAISSGPKNDKAYVEEIWILQAQGEQDKAFDRSLSALEKLPHSRQLNASHFTLLCNRKEYENALPYYKRAFPLSFEKHHAIAAFLYQMAGNLPKALAEIEQACAMCLDPLYKKRREEILGLIRSGNGQGHCQNIAKTRAK